jgi:hypothetical protein
VAADEYTKTIFPEKCFFDMDVDAVLTQEIFRLIGANSAVFERYNERLSGD